MSTDDDADDSAPTVGGVESEINQLLGLFDSPAFVRRGQDLEYALNRLAARLVRDRDGMLDMVRVRLRQWAGAATGPDDFRDVLRAPVAPLFALSGAEPPAWADRPAVLKKRLAVARDLGASVSRFNRRWSDLLDGLALDGLNRQIDHYNRYYVLEKECVLGSSRLAARHFSPKPPMNRDSLLEQFPTLPPLELVGA